MYLLSVDYKKRFAEIRGRVFRRALVDILLHKKKRAITPSFSF
jgi:hypothetical protein